MTWRRGRTVRLRSRNDDRGTPAREFAGLKPSQIMLNIDKQFPEIQSTDSKELKLSQGRGF